ncbi:MAG: NCS2 family permease [Acidobacteria bacterium]|nr:NCS2 family permease [Acidobacteriota bacterium]
MLLRREWGSQCPYFTYTVVKGMGYDWHVALGAVFISGVVFLILTLARIRAMIVDAIPMTMKTAVAVGIGLFIAFIGLKNAGVIVSSPATFVTPVNDEAGAARSEASSRCVAGARVSKRNRHRDNSGDAVFDSARGFRKPSNRACSRCRMCARLSAARHQRRAQAGSIRRHLRLSFRRSFDTIGSLMGLGRQAGYLDAEGRMPRVNRALFADAIATNAGSLLGHRPWSPISKARRESARVGERA